MRRKLPNDISHVTEQTEPKPNRRQKHKRDKHGMKGMRTARHQQRRTERRSNVNTESAGALHSWHCKSILITLQL